MDWISIVNRLGFPVAFSLAILYMVYKGGTWFAEHAVKPLVDSHLGFIISVEKHLESTDNCMIKQTEILSDIEQCMKDNKIDTSNKKVTNV